MRSARAFADQPHPCHFLVAANDNARGVSTWLAYDVLGRVTGKSVYAAGLTTVYTTNTYDEARAGYYNTGKLTSATRSVAANGAVPAVNVTRQFDHDLAGREARETHLAINGSNRVLSFAYWPDGSLYRKDSGDSAFYYRLLRILIKSTSAAALVSPDNCQ